MTEKRFDIIELEEELYPMILFLDNGKEMTYTNVVECLNALYEENQVLKKEIHLMHMRSMFSTVKSFKGDISTRYKYDEKMDTIYDTANHYGQYDMILDKKEIVMLLNEYNTLLGDKE